MYAKWCTMSNLAVPISRLYDFMDWILCSDDCWLVQTWQMLCGLKTILTDMNILNSYRHIRPKKVKYPIPEIPDDSGKKSGTDWVLPKIIGSGRVSGTRQALLMTSQRNPNVCFLQEPWSQDKAADWERRPDWLRRPRRRRWGCRRAGGQPKEGESWSQSGQILTLESFEQCETGRVAILKGWRF